MSAVVKNRKKIPNMKLNTNFKPTVQSEEKLRDQQNIVSSDGVFILGHTILKNEKEHTQKEGNKKNHISVQLEFSSCLSKVMGCWYLK